MTDRIEISATETGTIRLFAIDLPREAIERFTTQAGTGEYPLQYALGAAQLRNSFVDVVDLRDLDEMTLSGYLKQAYDVTGPDLKQARAQVDALTGHVLILPSSAFDKTAQGLAVQHPLRWIASFAEARPAGLSGRLRSKSAEGIIAPKVKKTPSDAAIMGRVATVALLVMFALAALLVVIAR